MSEGLSSPEDLLGECNTVREIVDVRKARHRIPVSTEYFINFRLCLLQRARVENHRH